MIEVPDDEAENQDYLAEMEGVRNELGQVENARGTRQDHQSSVTAKNGQILQILEDKEVMAVERLEKDSHPTNSSQKPKGGAFEDS